VFEDNIVTAVQPVTLEVASWATAFRHNYH